MDVMDHVMDANGVELHRLSQLYAFPDFVKHASDADTRHPGELPLTVYADPERRCYPCHTAASCWLSALFFQEKQAGYQATTARRIQQAIDAFAGYWGIKAAVEQLRARQTELNKAAELPDDAYALVWEGEDGRKERHLRLSSALEVKAAAAWLAEHRDRLAFADRQTVAGKILEKAASFGASLGEHEILVTRQAGQGFCSPRQAAQLLRQRAKLAADGPFRQSVEKTAQAVEKLPAGQLSGELLAKLAGVVEGIDRQVGLFGRYTDLLPRPEDVLFKTAFKEAVASDAVTLTTGRAYAAAGFQKLALADLQALFGDDFAQSVAMGLNVDPVKLAEQAAALPRPDAETFQKLLDEAGVPPLADKQAADRKSRRGAWEQLAAAY